jgi:hypothetical protein
MSKVSTIASDVRRWLKDSRSDGFSVHLQEFEDTLGNKGRSEYAVLVWATDIQGKLVASLSFKISYPWMKIYKCHVLPAAGGRRLTCQMYMVPMAFAIEDLRITRVQSKKLDPNLVDRFGFDEKGYLSLRDPSERDALQEVMENCYQACADVNKCFESRLGKSQLLIITDKAHDPLWSKVESLNPITMEGNPLGGQAFGFPVDKAESYRRFTEKGHTFPQVLWDVQKPLDEDVLAAAADAVKSAVKGWGGEVYVKKESELGPHLEFKNMVKQKTCTNGQCHERKCEDGVCYDVYTLNSEESLEE